MADKKLEITIPQEYYDLLIAIGQTIDKALGRPDEPAERHASIIFKEALEVVADRLSDPDMVAFMQEAIKVIEKLDTNAEVDDSKVN